ncbi:hypothetical protein ACIRL2_50670 [Embleya sp. NPDC127516]|uniref:hypothetical protein n=1 Tax=Embleya sp. NPDC127516 TaxID=3363990 RepID=UPI003811E982
MPSLVDKFGFAGTRGEVTERIEVPAKSGVDEPVIRPVADPETEMAKPARLLA